ncbi:ShlB/FhaC/HecB family hemolysin secretion/activation protein [Pantanalinema sp. GBBB05]|uniref:ShlB/FhaC/HecB family hemolysin secretion/activation protein n=1 Tax=Pantanalinema sp. GBBB05 TaxID=2604139 RepID=UPI003D8132E0
MRLKILLADPLLPAWMSLSVIMLTLGNLVQPARAEGNPQPTPTAPEVEQAQPGQPGTVQSTPRTTPRTKAVSLSITLPPFPAAELEAPLPESRPTLGTILGLGQPQHLAEFLVAQSPVQRIQPPSVPPLPEPPAPTPLPPPEQLLPAPTTPPETPGDPSIPLPETPTITVQRFEVTGSTVFSKEQFAAVTAPFTNKPISLAELFQARDKVTQLYVDNGYVTSGAYIPPQKLEGGVVEIRVVEGSLEDIKVTGTRRLSPNYVRRRIEVGTKTPLNRNQLLETLQLLRLNPLIENLSAELSAGSRPGVSLLEVRVAEADSFNTSLVFDNQRSPSVGSDRRQFQLNEGNLTGLGDNLFVAYINTQGSNEFDFIYSIPFNPRNGTISFSFTRSTSKVIEEPFDVLNIESESNYFELSIRQPLIQTPTQDFAIGLTGSYRTGSATLLGDIPFPALGADADGETKITALRFFQEYTQRSSQAVFAARSQFSFGLDALDSTINPDPPDSEFFAWRGQVQWVRLLAPDTLLLLRGDLQLADRPLVPVEQFGIGGALSVRGYRQDFLLTDNGFFGSAEVRIPILRLPKVPALLQLTPFVDFGTGWNNGDRPDPDPRTLASVGLGLRLQISNNFNARFEWGIPLVSTDIEKRTWQEKGLYFSIDYSPF